MAQATAQQATEAKQAGLDELTAAMKKGLHYAEDAAGGSDAKMAKLGWGGKAAPTALQAPGQPRLLEAAKEGAGWLILDWKHLQMVANQPFVGLNGASCPVAHGRWWPALLLSLKSP